MGSKKNKLKRVVLWIVVVAISSAIIFFGNRFSADGLNIFVNGTGDNVRGNVVKIIGKETTENVGGSLGNYKTETIRFTAVISDGKDKGKQVMATQSLNNMYAGTDTIREVKEGDRILLMEVNIPGTEKNEWKFMDYYRMDKIFMLAGAFALLLVLLGGIKGINTIVSLGFTFGFVFFVFVPWIMNGYNVYLGVIGTCLFTIVMTLLLINGATKKSFVTMAGCVSGTIVAAGVTYIMNYFLHLSGFIDEHSVYLTMVNPNKPVDLVAIVFAAIIIGALGAIMDVAMDISSSLYELSEHVPDISFKKLVSSGMRIGSDIMGTMANTLVLAYIGSSLCSVMLLITYSASIEVLLNRELVIVEILQALTGSVAILLTAPLTVLISGMVYIKKKGR